MNPLGGEHANRIVDEFLSEMVVSTEEVEGRSLDWLHVGHAFNKWMKQKGYSLSLDTMHLKSAFFAKYGTPPWTTVTLRA